MAETIVEGAAAPVRECLKASWELATYVASIHWDGSGNGREWLSGLRDAVEDVQAKLKSVAPDICRGSMPMCASAVDRMIERAESFE